MVPFELFLIVLIHNTGPCIVDHYVQYIYERIVKKNVGSNLFILK